MRFTVEVKFLSIIPQKLRDGNIYYTVQFFMDGAPVSVNIMANEANAGVIEVLSELEFGDKVTAVFWLKPEGKLYKLKLDHLV